MIKRTFHCRKCQLTFKKKVEYTEIYKEINAFRDTCKRDCAFGFNPLLDDFDKNQ